MAVMFIASATSSETRFTTNSPVSRIFPRVSFGHGGLWLPIPTPTTGGSPEKALKNEKGAAFTTPFLSRLTTQAIGRGVTVDTSSL